jgi:hypothetical protein
MYRCGLPRRDVTDFKACFEEAWYLYQPHVEPEAAIKDFRTRYVQRDCKIHFLGIWDTVKSYGGLRPISLPHLRHNPIVGTVRHALGLDERRSWFNATTWGQLDLDENGAKTRLKKEDLPNYLSQDIEEVWFRGCHSDVGGGDVEECTAKIALRWMLGEAVAAGLRLNEDGRLSLMTDDPTWPPVIHESLRGFWWLTEYLPRQEIDNSGEYPVKKWKRGRTGVRKPHELTRQQHWSLHTTARAAIKYVDTKTLGDRRGGFEVDRALK